MISTVFNTRTNSQQNFRYAAVRVVDMNASNSWAEVAWIDLDVGSIED